jgi:hypothetical protein
MTLWSCDTGRDGEFQVFAPVAADEDEPPRPPASRAGWLTDVATLPGRTSPDPLAMACVAGYVLGVALVALSAVTWTRACWVLLAAGSWACLSSAAGWLLLRRASLRRQGEGTL